MLRTLEELKERVSRLEKLLLNLVKVGEIVSVNPEKATVRILFKDRDKKVSAEIPVSFHHTKGIKLYSMPREGQIAWCIFPANMEDYGILIGSSYNEKDKPPQKDKSVHLILFPDGTKIEYDERVKKITVYTKGSVEITAVTTHNGDITINGNLTVNGNITASGEIADLGGSKGTLSTLRDTYNIHTHNNSSPPDQTL